MSAATTSNVEIIDRAQVPKTPIKPNKRKNLALGLILGAMLGVGLAFLLDYVDRTIKDEDDIKDSLGLTVLGTIPQIPVDDKGRSRQLVTQLEPFSSQSEAFLALRTSLLYIITNQKHKTVLLSSCLLGEGKSTIAANLAVVLAQTGAKTLLIDCDLRRPALDKIFAEEKTPGLTDLLVNKDQKAIRSLPHINFDFIPAGTEPPNPTQFLGSNQMKRFLAKAHDHYDYVVIDAPPLLPVADALILASQVDLNVMVLESCRVPVKLARRAVESLHHHGAKIAGAVINDKSGKGAKYYGHYSYYRGKYYQGYYRQDASPPHLPIWSRALSRIWAFING
jgi:tyrosine-protein kinase Etk/Wzc